LDKPDKNKDQKIKPAKQDENIELINEISKDKEKAKRKGFISHFISRILNEKLSAFRGGLGGILDEYKDYKSKVIEKYEAYETVVAGSTDTIEYYILLILSCLVATMGLYQNSPAIIIGAMIVAPLMGPVFGFSAGMLWGTGRVIREAVTTLFKGTIVVVLVSAVMSFSIPGITITSEMISRCNPSLFDIIVALCCGLIGSYAFINKRVSNAIPGVAISVALLPPLCTVGIGIGLFNWELAKGAALLYGINLICISLSALVVFYLVRLHPRPEDKDEFTKAKVRAIGQMFISVIVIVIICIPLVLFMITTFKNNYEKQIIYSTIEKILPEDEIFSAEIDDGDITEIKIILLKKSLSPVNTKDMEKIIKEALSKPVKLELYLISENKKETNLKQAININ